MNKTLVMKFGGAALATPDHIFHIAELIAEKKSEYQRLVVVVSAMGSTTDQLIALAQSINPFPPQREYDMLISAGERISMSLLAMALAKLNLKASSFTGSQSGIITNDCHGGARIITVRPIRLSAALDKGEIVIVAGFQGVSENKEITTLGRGGSDTSAVALALALSAEKVEFYKDVEGVYLSDPKLRGLDQPQEKPFEELSYQEALAIVDNGARILHGRAIELAARNSLPLHVRSFLSLTDSFNGTLICCKTLQRQKSPLYELDDALNENFRCEGSVYAERI